MESTTPTRVPFGWHFAEELSHSPRMGDETKTQTPVWTSGDGEKEESGKMDWAPDTDDTDDLPKEDPPNDDE
jgi:hypothetical protein